MTFFSSPQLFPKEVIFPFDFFSYEKVSSNFFIPDCQNVTQIKQINKLASLFSNPNFNYCLLENGGIDKVQVLSCFGSYQGPELNSEGRIKQDPFQNLHVISAQNVQQLIEKRGVCPICCKKINMLISCPLMELKLKYPNRDIPSGKELFLSEAAEKQLSVGRPSSLRFHQEFSLIHLIFLLELAWHGKDPQIESIPDGIITKFFENDCEYAEEVWQSLRHELSIKKSRLWIRHLKKRHDLATLRGNLYAFLYQFVKTQNYQPRSYSNRIIYEYEASDQLKEIRDLLATNISPNELDNIPPSPIKKSLQLLEARTYFSLRDILLVILFAFTFFYFLSMIFVTFLKRKFLFGEDI